MVFPLKVPHTVISPIKYQYRLLSRRFSSFIDPYGYVVRGTIYLSYGPSGITFNTVTDYLIFVNEVILPLTDKMHSASGSGMGFVAASSGTASSDAITD